MPSFCSVQPVDLFELAQQPIGREPAGNSDASGMLGDGDVLQAERPRGFRHFADAVVAVGCGGVHVQVAAQVVAA